MRGVFATALAVLIIASAVSSVADSSSSTQNSLDLSGLSNLDQGKANVLVCLVECERDDSLDARYERGRYDVYYETESGFVLSDPTDPDSDVVGCSEISCEPPPRAAAIRSICLARYERFRDYTRCALKCTSLGRMYDETLFDDVPLSTYKTNVADGINQLCERFNNSPFGDYDSSCPAIAFVDGEPQDCSELNDVLESQSDNSIRPRGVNLNEVISDRPQNEVRFPIE